MNAFSTAPAAAAEPRGAAAAEAAYASAHAQAFGLLAEIETLLEDLPAPDAIEVNWAHVGSLAEVNRRLAEIKDFLAG